MADRQFYLDAMLAGLSNAMAAAVFADAGDEIIGEITDLQVKAIELGAKAGTR